MPVPAKLKGRYEIREILGQGATGLVHKAFDLVSKREVALKALRSTPPRAALQLFYKQCELLASIRHPNLVEILDTGEFEEEGGTRPYLVMPLLAGATLGNLLRGSGAPLPVERIVDIVVQAGRGLQAAHARGAVHRDVRPSNVFVLEDGSAKLLDFGVAHLFAPHETSGPKGALAYMAPEQHQRKPATPLTDVFSLAVVCYEALTGRQPFERPTENEIIAAAQHAYPPLACELNPAVSRSLSQVVHKGMAKEFRRRFPSAQEFAETLQRALRNEPIEFLDPARAASGIVSATQALEQGDDQLAGKILSGLEAEGHDSPEIPALRSRIDQAQRQQNITRLLEMARARYEQGQYSLAQQKIQEVLALDPANSAALGLKAAIGREQLTLTQLLSEVLPGPAPQSGAAAPDPPERGALPSNPNPGEPGEEALQNAQREARKRLAERDFAGALAICREVLSAHPENALFQALKLDAEEQQKRELHARIAETDRRLEAEPDLDRRVKILEEAVAGYPSEPHFQDSLRILREKRDLVNSLVARARRQEERGQFDEALQQWETLRTIYGQYPGLSIEIERLAKRRNQHARSESKAHWVAEFDRQMEARDFNAAQELLRNAQAEFPNDPELLELQELVHRTMDRGAEAERLLAEGRQLCAQGRYADGQEVLHHASRLDPRHPAIRAARISALLDQARQILDTDWRAAETLLQQALELDPSHLLARSLRIAVVDRKREEDLVRCFSLVHQLRAAGDLKGALAAAEECLASYPMEPRVIQMRDILAKEFEVARPEPEWPPAPAPGPVQPPAPPPPAAPVPPVAVQTPAPAPVAPAPAPPAPAPPAPAPPAKPPVKLPPPAPAKPAPPRAPISVRLAGAIQALRSRPALLWGVIGTLAVVAVLVAGIVAVLVLRRAPPPPPAAVAVEVRTSPPGATIRINNQARGVSNLTLQLPPGAYQLEAVLDGYQPVASSLDVRPGPRAPMELTLLPVPQIVRLISNLEAGQVWIDDQPARELQEGQIILDNLAPGRHTLKVSDRYSEASFAFEILPGAAPVIGTPITAKNVVALLLSNAAGRARLHSNLSAAKLVVDGQPAGEVGPAGLELSSLPPGTHELVLGEGASHRKFIADISPAPALTAFLQSDRNVGTLLLVAGEDNVTVFLNGQKYSRLTRRGQLRITREPREYRVRVAKEGFQEAPEQVVQIRKGEESRLEFKLRPLPAVAALSIRGATPGAQVLLDQNPIGTVETDGSFSFSNVSPGEHTIELRKDKFKPRQVRRAFAAGQTVQLAESEVALRGTVGTLRVTFSPAGARVILTRAGEAQPRVLGGASLELEEGSYTLVAQAPGYQDHTEQVKIVAGQTASLTVNLSREPQRVAPVAVRGMEGFEEPKAWTQEGNWYLRRGGGFVLYRAAPAGGTFAFNVMLAAGGGILRGKRLEWVVGFRDEKNYLLFQLDRDSFRRIQVVNGRRTESRKPHGLPMKDYLVATLRIDVTATEVIHRVRKGEQWAVLDSFTVPGQSPAAGQFGLLIQGKDEVRLSDFSFYPK